MVRIIGTMIGVLASLIMVAPDGTKSALYRVLIGVTMGFIFAPLIHNLPFAGFLDGDESDVALARAAVAGFITWFILEFIARMMSSTDWLVKTAQALLDIRAKGGK